jgi:hypothetical protein
LLREPRLELGITLRVVERVLPIAIACLRLSEGEVEAGE